MRRSPVGSRLSTRRHVTRGAPRLLGAASIVVASAFLTASPGARGQDTSEAAGVRLRAVGDGPVAGSAAAVVVDAGALAHTAQFWPGVGSRVPRGAAGTEAQVRDVLQQLDVALRAAGTSLEALVRVHAYVADASVTPVVARVLAERVGPSHRPALTLVETPMPLEGAVVAMDAVAATAQPALAGRPTRVVAAGLAAQPGGGAHVAVQPEGPFVIVSGRAAPGAFEEGLRATLAELERDLAGVGLGLEHVVHVKAFAADMSRAADLQRIVADAFAGTPPPQVVTGWTGATVPAEIELVAVGPVQGGEAARVSMVEPVSSRFSRVARVRGGRPVFTSGLAGTAADPAAQVDEMFAQLRRLAEIVGSDLRHLVKATYYVTDPEADARINTIRPTVYAADAPPAASKIRVPGHGQPQRAAVMDMLLVTRDR